MVEVNGENTTSLFTFKGGKYFNSPDSVRLKIVLFSPIDKKFVKPISKEGSVNEGFYMYSGVLPGKYIFFSYEWYVNDDLKKKIKIKY